MKIRIKGNSLRLRLTKSEIMEFSVSGRVADSIRFGDSEIDLLEYELIRSSNHLSLTAEFSGAEITVYMPKELANNWTESEVVGLTDQQSVGSEILSILIEKDFQCLNPRDGENETDHFPNPAGQEKPSLQ